jgi:predicted nucleotidyltransferase
MSTTPSSTVSDAQLPQMAAEILQEITGAEGRLFGSHARGEAGSGSSWPISASLATSFFIPRARLTRIVTGSAT